MEKNYISIDAMKERLTEIFSEVIDSLEKNEIDIIEDYIDIEERAEYMAERFNADMKKYLHMDSQRIMGNFNNARTDYERENEGQKFSEMVTRLDNGENTPRAKEDREWLTSWFWETFGTYNIKYNFSTEIGELICDLNEEDE